MPASRERERAQEKAYRWLVYRPRTEYEIASRLKAAGFGQEIVTEVLEVLKKQKLVDDWDYALRWIRWRMRSKPRGKDLLYRELVSKGIAPSTANSAVQTISAEEEFEAALQLFKDRLEKGAGVEKTVRHLMRRGFPAPVVYRVYQRLKGGKPSQET